LCNIVGECLRVVLLLLCAESGTGLTMPVTQHRSIRKIISHENRGNPVFGCCFWLVLLFLAGIAKLLAVPE
jgi:hypothetical protein